MGRIITRRVCLVNTFRVSKTSQDVNNERMETFAQRLKRLRELHKMTQEQLADACGYRNQSRIGNYESGLRTPSMRELPVLAKGLGVPDQELMVPGVTLPQQDQDSSELVELRLAVGLTAAALAESIPAAGDALLAALKRTFDSPRTGTFPSQLIASVKEARNGAGSPRHTGSPTELLPRKRPPSNRSSK